jgi:hypothetical protein
MPSEHRRLSAREIGEGIEVQRLRVYGLYNHQGAIPPETSKKIHEDLKGLFPTTKVKSFSTLGSADKMKYLEWLKEQPSSGEEDKGKEAQEMTQNKGQESGEVTVVPNDRSKVIVILGTELAERREEVNSLRLMLKERDSEIGYMSTQIVQKLKEDNEYKDLLIEEQKAEIEALKEKLKEFEQVPSPKLDKEEKEVLEKLQFRVEGGGTASAA